MSLSNKKMRVISAQLEEILPLVQQLSIVEKNDDKKIYKLIKIYCR